MSAPIVLYDIPGNRPGYKCWSPNTWKVRFALNYKGLPLKSEWVEYPDIEAVYRKLGIETTDKDSDGSPLYTLPIIYDPSTQSAISDSMRIAKYLDKTYPNTPILFPAGTLALHSTFQSAWYRVQGPLWAIVACSVCSWLNERSQIFYRTTREADEGKKLEEIRGEKEWKAGEEAFGNLDKWLSANGEGKDELVMGEGVCYADLQIVSGLMWAKTTLAEDDWKRICGWHNGKWERIVNYFSKYAVVDL
ncbi:hypothetical protein EW026_g3319 [Hermanssonia centrifuga]|uniref:GST N-terminal domain-containing protein n=1 Tax=Hermanssonia centrifuga TaxID=98765 RepID=A0A4S4KKH5_9APHY|nr:hypothetical protein EW026_g3319 [Hermanssonia centrifuga]